MKLTKFEIDNLIKDNILLKERVKELKLDKQALKKQLSIYGVGCSLPSKEVINFLEKQEDFYIQEDELANKSYNAALDDVKYFIEKEEEKLK